MTKREELHEEFKEAMSKLIGGACDTEGVLLVIMRLAIHRNEALAAFQKLVAGMDEIDKTKA